MYVPKMNTGPQLTDGCSLAMARLGVGEQLSMQTLTQKVHHQ